jgi:hypothetical protein
LENLQLFLAAHEELAVGQSSAMTVLFDSTAMSAMSLAVVCIARSPELDGKGAALAVVPVRTRQVHAARG